MATDSLGVVDFASPGDLHSSTQEVHPDGDKLIVVLAGALDVVLDDGTGETTIALDVGGVAIVAHGTWHRLVMREPGGCCSSTSEQRCKPNLRRGEPVMAIDFDQIDIVAGDMDATLAFYRRLGVQIPKDAIWRTATSIHHVDITMPSGMIVHFDSQRLAASYNAGWQAPDRTRSGNVLSFKVAERTRSTSSSQC